MLVLGNFYILLDNKDILPVIASWCLSAQFLP